MSDTEDFLAEIEAFSRLELDKDVLKRAREALLDYIGVTYAGATFQSDKLEKYLDFAEPEPGQYMAIGLDRNVALKDAVFLNGLNGHALDLDDGTNSGIIHLGAPIFSLLIPLAQKYRIKLEDMLWAAIIGYETSYTMAISIQPKHKLLGYHATGTCGVLGATIAASYMLGFTDEQRMNAFSTACVSATGMLKVLDDGAELKPYNVAKTSLLSLTSIQLARADYAGHKDALGGERGYLKMMTGCDDITIKKPMDNGLHAIKKTYIKPYASCRYTHPAIGATIEIMKNEKVDIENIESIKVVTYSLAVKGHNHVKIECPASAKMSIPYGVAAAILYGNAMIEEFDMHHITTKKMQDLLMKISVTEDENISANFPKTQTAIVEIKDYNGCTYSRRVDLPKGEPENPLTDDEIKQRFYSLMRYAGVEHNTIDHIFEFIMYGNDDITRLWK